MSASTEPTRIWGNLSSVAAAGAGVAATAIPGPWGAVIASALGLLSVIFTEVNRAKVNPVKDATSIEDLKASVSKMDAAVEAAKKL
jgi:hypothetical protein